MSGYPQPPPGYGYGAPPPTAQPYGAPPPTTQPYGAPPPTSQPYGAPPPTQQHHQQQPPYATPYAPSYKPEKPHSESHSSYGGGGGGGGAYPSQPGYASPFASLMPSSFPPGTDPNVVACFQVADQDGSGFIDDKELQRALSSYNQSFSLRTVHLLMYLFTNSNSRKIGTSSN